MRGWNPCRKAVVSAMALLLAAGAAAADAFRVADINTTDIANDGLPVGRGVVLGSALVFDVRTAEDRLQLWRSDGSAAGTTLIKNIFPGDDGGSIQEIVKLGALAFFQAEDPAGGRELWRSDGTAAGTFRLVDLHAGPAGSTAKSMCPIPT